MHLIVIAGAFAFSSFTARSIWWKIFLAALSLNPPPRLAFRSASKITNRRVFDDFLDSESTLYLVLRCTFNIVSGISPSNILSVKISTAATCIQSERFAKLANPECRNLLR
jgi:hypothetical protein